jgi:hypothetical protein
MNSSKNVVTGSASCRKYTATLAINNRLTQGVMREN